MVRRNSSRKFHSKMYPLARMHRWRRRGTGSTVTRRQSLAATGTLEPLNNSVHHHTVHVEAPDYCRHKFTALGSCSNCCAIWMRDHHREFAKHVDNENEVNVFVFLLPKCAPKLEPSANTQCPSVADTLSQDKLYGTPCNHT